MKIIKKKKKKVFRKKKNVLLCFISCLSAQDINLFMWEMGARVSLLGDKFI